ncbi:hypothetical protein ACFL2Q_11025 [Thermodesulfobacteriota bacterium]
MSEPIAESWPRRTVARLVAIVVPPLATLGLFLVLYNNSLYGRGILVGLILINIAVPFIPSRKSRFARSWSWAKVSSLCLAAGLVTLLALEMLFPYVLPRDFAQTRDMAKGARRLSAADAAMFSRVFTNDGQRTVKQAASAPGATKTDVEWHVPGGVFEYYGYEPNDKFRYVNLVRWNSRGYFDHDYPFEKPAAAYRIVFIGDSYVESIQVPLASTFHKLLGTALNEFGSRSTEPPVIFEVIALGNSGSGQRNHLKALKNEALLYNPDMVVTTLCQNDFCDDDPTLNLERALDLGEVTPRLRGMLRHGLYAPAFALNRYQQLLRNRIKISPELLQWSSEPIPRIEQAWERTLGFVADSNDFCRSKGIEFRLVHLSSELELKYAMAPEATILALKSLAGPHWDFPWDPTRSLKRLNRFAKEHGVKVISLHEPFVAAQKSTGKLIFGDHFSFFGHQIAAQALQSELNLRPRKDPAPAKRARRE